MKPSPIKPQLWLILSVIILTLWSCTKEKAVQPTVKATDVASSTENEALQSGELLLTSVSPGLYRIARFIDTGDDETAQFDGYTFEFQADGDLIATTRTGRIVRGSWSVNSAGTRMDIIIGGNEALEDLDDDDWRINRLTNHRIRISAPDPDIVVFVKIQ